MAKFIAWGATCPNLASERCPCLLADFRACPNCSHLAGYPLCDCEWRGFCPFLEGQWSKTQPVPVGAPPRVMASSQSAPRVIELAVSVGDRRLEPYARPGAVVQVGLNDTQKERFHPTAIVADVDLKLRAVLLSLSLAQPENMLLGEADIIWMATNPGNMLFGSQKFMETAESEVLVIASGIAQSALPLLVKDLRHQRNSVTALVAPGKAGANYVVGRVQSLGAIVHEVDTLQGQGRDLIRKLLREKNFSLVISLGGEDQNKWLGQVLADLGSMLPVVACDTYRYPMLTE